MSLSYEYSIGSVRAKENNLLSSADIEHMLSCKTISELCRFLNDKGYGDGESIDEILLNHSKNTWSYLKSIAPQFDIFDCFVYQNDVHNLKCVLKGTMASREYVNLLVTPCTIEKEKLVTAVENRNFAILPEWISQKGDRAYELLAHAGDARASDAVLDKALMEMMLKSSKQTKSEFLFEYFCTFVFFSNVKIALRSSRTGTTKEFLLSAFCDVDNFNKSAVIESTLKGEETLVELLSKYSDYDCNKAIEQFKISPTLFEKFVDDKLILMAKQSCKRASEGADPLMGYLIANRAEKKIIHIIFSSIHTNSSMEKTRERLREIYG